MLPRLVNDGTTILAITDAGLYDLIHSTTFQPFAKPVDVTDAIAVNGKLYLALLNGNVRIVDKDIRQHKLHTREIKSMSKHSNGFVTGCRDHLVKLWNEKFELSASYRLPRTIWSVKASESNVFVGCLAARQTFAPSPSLFVLRTLPTGLHLLTTSSFNKGAVYHTVPVSPNDFITFGNDGVLARFDSRISYSDPVASWADEHDYPLFTGALLDNKLVVGTGHHSVVRLFDLRNSRMIGSVFVGKRSSPVYSITWSRGDVYCATDREVSRICF